MTAWQLLKEWGVQVAINTCKILRLHTYFMYETNRPKICSVDGAGITRAQGKANWNRPDMAMLVRMWRDCVCAFFATEKRDEQVLRMPEAEGGGQDADARKVKNEGLPVVVGNDSARERASSRVVCCARHCGLRALACFRGILCGHGRTARAKLFSRESGQPKRIFPRQLHLASYAGAVAESHQYQPLGIRGGASVLARNRTTVRHQSVHFAAPHQISGHDIAASNQQITGLSVGLHQLREAA